MHLKEDLHTVPGLSLVAVKALLVGLSRRVMCVFNVTITFGWCSLGLQVTYRFPVF